MAGQPRVHDIYAHAHVEDQAGVLPAGITKADHLKALSGEERTQYALGTAYYTALVMGLLCAACLRPDRAPSVQLVGSQVDPSFVAFLLDRLEHDQRHWQPIMSDLVDTEQRTVAPFLLDIAIAQKCHIHDYRALAELLEAAHRANVANSPMCAQAAQLLERLAECSRVLRATQTDGRMAR